MDRFSKWEQMFVGGCGLLFITSFLDFWIKVEFGGETIRGNAFDYGGFGDLMPWVALAGLILGLVKVFGSATIPPVVYAGVGVAVLAFLLLMLIIGPDDQGAGALGVEVSRGFFLFIGVLVGAAAAYGGYMMMKDAEAGGPAAPPASPPPSV